MADPAKVYSEQTRRARKQYKCYECRAVILPKTDYTYISGIWDKPESFRQCEECTKAIAEINAIFAPFRSRNIWLDDDFCFSLGRHFYDAKDAAWELRYDLKPGQYYRVLKLVVQMQRRRKAAKEAA